MDILSIIMKDTYTLSQLKGRVRAIKAKLVSDFFGGVNLQPEVSDINWLSSLPPDFYGNFSKDNVYQILENLEKQIGELPTLTMYLTFEPDEATISQIGNFTRKTFGPDNLLDIKHNPALIAGCSLVWKGRVKDYSLRARMEEKKGEILESFKKFLR